jgi:hypothetical protein
VTPPPNIPAADRDDAVGDVLLDPLVESYRKLADVFHEQAHPTSQAQAAPAALKEVSNHRLMFWSDASSPLFKRSGRLPPALDTEVASTGVNGSPDWTTAITLNCHPPSI